MYKKLFLNLILFLVISEIAFSQMWIDELYPEISSEELAAYEISYVIEENKSEKKYLELVVKPEKFDLNKDRKISKQEIRKALNYVFYTDDAKANKQIPDEVKTHITNNINLFISQIELDFLNFKQFAFLIKQLNFVYFFDLDGIGSKLKAMKEKRIEPEAEL